MSGYWSADRKTDVRSARLAGRARYEWLMEAGVRIYEWQPTTLHTKTIVVDGLWSAVGTMNFDNRSLALNEEVMLMVLDPGFAARMDAMFAEDLRNSLEIDLDGSGPEYRNVRRDRAPGGYTSLGWDALRPPRRKGPRTAMEGCDPALP